ncbi:unnamed protein product [Choristocarpus tenellus]
MTTLRTVISQLSTPRPPCSSALYSSPSPRIDYGMDSVRDLYMGGNDSGVAPGEDFGLFWGIGQSNSDAVYSDAMPTRQGRVQGSDRDSSADFGGHNTALQNAIRETTTKAPPSPGMLIGQDPMDSYGHRRHVNRERKESRWQAHPVAQQRQQQLQQLQQVRKDPTSPITSTSRHHSRAPSPGGPTVEDAIIGSKLDELVSAITSSLIKRLEPRVEQMALQMASNLSGEELKTDPSPTRNNEISMIMARMESLEKQVRLLQAATDERTVALSGRIDRLDAQCVVEPAGWGEAGISVGRAVSLLSQRTGTMEGRHKIVQSKVAQLDNALGLKAQDWGQALSSILAERAHGSHAPAAVGRSERRLRSNKNSKGAGGTPRGGGGGRGGAGWTERGTQEEGKHTYGSRPAGDAEAGVGTALDLVGVTSTAEVCTSGVSALAGKKDGQGGAGKGKVEVGVRGHPCMDRTGKGNDSVQTTAFNNAPLPENRQRGVAAYGEQAKAHLPGGGRSGCECKDTADRCLRVEDGFSRLEERCAQAEEGLLQLRESSGALTLNVVEDKGKSGDGAAGGRHQWALKSSVDQLRGDLKNLSEAWKEKEDALTLMDQGLSVVQEQLDPLQTNLSGLKKLVETQIREKQLAQDMVKEYISVITREVATMTRRYINGILMTQGRAVPVGSSLGLTAMAGLEEGVMAEHESKVEPAVQESTTRSETTVGGLDLQGVALVEELAGEEECTGGQDVEEGTSGTLHAAGVVDAAGGTSEKNVDKGRGD